MKVKSFLSKHGSTVVGIFLLFAFRWSFADQYRVPSGSMLPTIHIGDHLFTNKMAYDFKIPFTDFKLARTGEPLRGDVAVFIYPKDESINFVKRIIGLPGETLKIENSKIFINNIELDEKYLSAEIKQSMSDTNLEIIIPTDMYFMMGDNRGNSYDSRYWGLVPRKNLKGKVLAVLWNISFPSIIPEIEILRIGKKI